MGRGNGGEWRELGGLASWHPVTLASSHDSHHAGQNDRCSSSASNEGNRSMRSGRAGIDLNQSARRAPTRDAARRSSSWTSRSTPTPAASGQRSANFAGRRWHAEREECWGVQSAMALRQGRPGNHLERQVISKTTAARTGITYVVSV